MIKQIDAYRRGDVLGKDPKDWKRQMVLSSVMERFGLWVKPEMLGGHHSLPDSARCPECNSEMHVGMSSFVTATGSKITTYFPQCNAYANNPDHGYSRSSRHSLRSGVGKKGKFESSPSDIDREIEGADDSDGGNGSGSNSRKANKPADAPGGLKELLEKSIAEEKQRKEAAEKAAQEQQEKEQEEMARKKNLKKLKEEGRLRHERYNDVVRLIKAGCRAILLEGPAGSGKTQIAWHYAEDNSLPIITVSGNAETDATELTKGRNPVSLEEKISSLMERACSGPGVGVIDEIDGIQPSVMLAMNMPLAQRKITVGGKVHEVHPDFIFVATANASSGATRTYSGRFPVDGATKSRWVSVFVDYSDSVDHCQTDNEEIVNEIKKVRKMVNSDPTLVKLFGALVGTRLVQQADLVSKAYDLDGAAAVRKVFELGYSKDDRSKLGF